MAPTDAAATPLPRDATTPPAMKMYLVAIAGCASSVVASGGQRASPDRRCRPRGVATPAAGGRPASRAEPRGRVALGSPPFASSDARILLRLGDEVHETLVPLPQRFVIAPSAVSLPLGDETFALACRAAAAGEPALPGGPGVLAW